MFDIKKKLADLLVREIKVTEEVEITPLEKFVQATDKDILKVYRRTVHELNDVAFEVFTVLGQDELVLKTEERDLFIIPDTRDVIIGETAAHKGQAFNKVLKAIIASDTNPFTRQIEMLKTPVFSYLENLAYLTKLK